MIYSVGGLIVLVLDIICIMQVVQSSMDSGKKLLWILIIILLPILGPILWLLIGRGG
jgi:hypothetical protein